MTDKSAVVIDNGSGVIKTGYAGATSPQAKIPSLIGRPKYPRSQISGRVSPLELYVGEDALKLRGLLNYSYPITHGQIKNVEELSDLWDHAYQKVQAKSSEVPLLVTESPLNSKRDRELLLDMAFNHFAVPKLSVAVQAVLALFAAGRSSGLVLDSGDGVTSVVPIFEGFSLTHAIRRSNLGGRDVTEYLTNLLHAAGTVIYAGSEYEIIKDLKENMCSVSREPISGTKGVPNRGGPDNTATVSYTLPDGSELQLGSERSQAPELLFNPKLWGYEDLGAHDLVLSSISRSDIELRRELHSNIVVSGGSTMLPGFIERLLHELRRSLPQKSLIRVFGPPNRDESTFIGGCILAALPTFEKHLVTKQDWDEQGTTVISRGLIRN